MPFKKGSRQTLAPAPSLQPSSAQARPGTTKIHPRQLCKGDLTLIKNRPCEILDFTFCKAGYGEKLHIVAYDLFTGQKLEEVQWCGDESRRPMTPEELEKWEAPVIKYADYTVLDISEDGFLTLSGVEDDNVREDLTLPEGFRRPGGKGDREDSDTLRESIKAMFEEGKSVIVTVMSSELCGQSLVVAAKEDVE